MNRKNEPELTPEGFLTYKPDAWIDRHSTVLGVAGWTLLLAGAVAGLLLPLPTTDAVVTPRGEVLAPATSTLGHILCWAVVAACTVALICAVLSRALLRLAQQGATAHKDTFIEGDPR